MLAGGTRQLSGLEEQVKKRVKEIAKACGMEVQFAVIAQADFATVRGAVLWQCQKQEATQPIETEAVMSTTPSTEKPNNARYLFPGLAGIVVVLVAAFFMVTGMPHSSAVDVTENFVLIRGGEFTMGSPTYEPERQSNEAQHQVKVSDFYMSKYEVTQAEWESVMSSNPSYFKGKNLPVENVSWYDCQAFIQALNRKTGKTYRLPTEAEWEYACRAGTTTPFNTGGNLTTEQANYDGNNYPYHNNPKGQYLKKTVPVDRYAPNAWGLYNMHGNVWEWCSDWYGDYESGRVENPTGPISGSHRVLRGGSWRTDARNCRSAYRANDDPPDYRNLNVGFRLVFVP
ncbi:MAG: formylglycine-generating enzyme family protein [Chlorobiaceae bacterium]|nr:formylglycine-generating enzyme family protein [Chlorobiaceae bacterium]